MTTDYYTQLPQIRLGDFTGRSVQPETTAEVMLDGDDVSLTSPIRPAVPEFSSGKSLNGKERRGPKRRKSAVVPTKSILSAANVPIIGGHHGSCAAKFAGRMESNTAIGALSRTRGSPGGAWGSGTCCTWARSTTRRNWRGGGRSRFWRTAPRNLPPICCLCRVRSATLCRTSVRSDDTASATNCHPCASSALNDRDPAREILHLLCLPWFGIALGFMG